MQNLCSLPQLFDISAWSPVARQTARQQFQNGTSEAVAVLAAYCAVFLVCRDSENKKARDSVSQQSSLQRQVHMCFEKCLVARCAALSHVPRGRATTACASSTFLCLGLSRPAPPSLCVDALCIPNLPLYELSPPDVLIGDTSSIDFSRCSGLHLLHPPILASYSSLRQYCLVVPTSFVISISPRPPHLFSILLVSMLNSCSLRHRAISLYLPAIKALTDRVRGKGEGDRGGKQLY